MVHPASNSRGAERPSKSGLVRGKAAAHHKPKPTITNSSVRDLADVKNLGTIAALRAINKMIRNCLRSFSIATSVALVRKLIETY